MGKDGPKYSQMVQFTKRYGIMIARKKHEGRNELGKEAREQGSPYIFGK
jgi:hypothetical protein